MSRRSNEKELLAYKKASTETKATKNQCYIFNGGKKKTFYWTEILGKPSDYTLCLKLVSRSTMSYNLTAASVRVCLQYVYLAHKINKNLLQLLSNNKGALVQVPGVA